MPVIGEDVYKIVALIFFAFLGLSVFVVVIGLLVWAKFMNAVIEETKEP